MTQKNKIKGAEIELVNHAQRYKQFDIKKIIIKYLHKIPVGDLKAVETIDVYVGVKNKFSRLLWGQT